MKKAAIYTRVSSDEQIKGFSLENQFESCKKFIELKGWEFYKLFREEGESGYVLKRTQLTQLIKEAREKKFDALVFYRIDRLARNQIMFLNLIAELNNLGIEVRSVSEPFEVATTTGKLIISTLSAFAEFERNLIKERNVGGMIKSMNKGTWFGSVPFGYNRKNKNLIINKKEAEIVKLIYHLFINKGMGVGRIQKTIIGMKISTKYAYRRTHKKKNKKIFWDQNTIYHVLRNEAYTGETYFRKYADRSKFRARKILRPKEDWIKINVPKIIDKKVFIRAESIRDSRFKSRENFKKVSDSLLRSILKCGICGRAYTRSIQNHFKKKHFYRTKYYICTNKRKFKTDKLCPAIQIRTCILDVVVWYKVKELLTRPESLYSYIDKDLYFKSYNFHKLLLVEYKNSLSCLSFKQKREIIRSIIEKVIVYKNYLKLYCSIPAINKNEFNNQSLDSNSESIRYIKFNFDLKYEKINFNVNSRLINKGKLLKRKIGDQYVLGELINRRVIMEVHNLFGNIRRFLLGIKDVEEVITKKRVIYKTKYSFLEIEFNVFKLWVNYRENGVWVRNPVRNIKDFDNIGAKIMNSYNNSCIMFEK